MVTIAASRVWALSTLRWLSCHRHFATDGAAKGTGRPLPWRGGTACILWRSPRRSDVDCCIEGWVRPIWRWSFSTVATLWAVSGAGFGSGSGNGGYACPGRWECWARVEASTVSRTLKVGRLVLRAPPRCLSSRKCMMSSLERGQLWAVREGDQSHYSRTLCRNAGKCITHADPASDRQRDARGGSLRSPSLPHRGYVGGFVGATSTVLGDLASASQPVSLAPPYHQTRLCDSVRPATSQVSRRPLYLSEGSGCPHLASRDRSPTGKWHDRAGPSSRYEVRVLQPLPKKSFGLRPILDLCVLNRALHRLPFKMLTPKRIFGCVRPQDWFAAIDLKDAYFNVSILPRHRPFLRFVFEGRAYQYKVLPFGLSLSPRVFTKVAEGRAHSQLPRRLAYTSSVSGSVMRTQGLGALAPQPVGPSGQLGKEQTLPDAEDLISRYGVGFGQSDNAPHAGMRSVGVELLEYIQEQDGGTTETVSEAPGAYGGCGHAAGLLHMRPLQHWLHGRVPRGGVAEWHAAGPSHSSLPPNLHPVVRPFIPSGRSAPGTGLGARRLAQPDSRRAVTSCAPRRVETPSPDGPADLVTFRNN